MIKIAVCDDLSVERANLISMLEQYWESRGSSRLSPENIRYTEYTGGEELLAASEVTPEAGSEKAGFSLIFLDIYMEGMSGVETARRLKAADPGCTIIFTTTSKEHGADAFDLEAFHYLVKPFQQEKLSTVMDKWYDEFCRVRTISLKQGRTVREVFVRDILYIDVMGRSSTVHTAAETFQVSSPLSAIEEVLPGGDFAKPIRYCIAALGQIRTIGEDSLTMANGETIPLSRRERDKIKQQLAAYRLRQLRGR